MKRFLFIPLLLVSSATWAADRAELLASTFLSNRPDVDYLPVHSCQEDREFVSAVKVKVLRDNARIDEVVVKFGNGDEQILAIREHFQRGSESRWVDLEGNRRCIRYIKVIGESGARLRQSLIEIYGLTSSLR